MTASEFLKKIEAFTPSRNDFIKAGYDNEFAEELMLEFKYQDLGSKNNLHNELLNLIYNYDVSKFVIGMVTFYRDLEENSDFYFFGNFEADKLAIDKRTGQVVMIDHGNTNFVMCLCAVDSEHFLSAICCSWKTLTEYLLHWNKSKNPKDRLKTINICTNEAGSEECRQFYESLL